MASIEERKRADGSTAYKAEVVLRIDGKRKKKSATFDRRTTAQTWAKDKEKELRSQGRDAFKTKETRKNIGDLIQLYLDDVVARDIGKTKRQVLAAIKREYDIAEVDSEDLTSHDVTRFARDLANGRAPSTVMNYLQHLSAVVSCAKAGFGINANKSAVQDGIAFCVKQGIAAPSEERDRRPECWEIDKLMELFIDQSSTDQRAIPMHIIVTYAMFSARRQAEICRITWSDFDSNTNRQMVRNMKNPGKKKGRDVRCEVTPEARRITEIMRRSRLGNNERIFPFNSDTVSRRFTNACKILGIEDLRFHDLRHEAASRLFEMGRTIPQVASVTGHQSWKSLERYTHLECSEFKQDKWADWKWWDQMEKINAASS